MSDVITIDRFTDGSIIQNADNQYEWTGTGVFDTIMKAVNGNIKVEFDNGRIAGPDYATVYLGSMQTAIGAAIDFILREKAVEEQIAASQADTAIKQNQSTADITLKAQQAALYERQRQGFDDNKYQKLLETQMNSWALMFSSGLLTEKPSIITSDQASILYDTLKPK